METKAALSTRHVRGNTAFFAFHNLTGLMTILQSLWLAVNVLRRHYRSEMTPEREPFRSQFSYPGPFTKRLPIDSVFRGCLFLAASCQQVRSCCFDIYGFQPAFIQHSIVFFASFLSSVFEILECRSRAESSPDTTKHPSILPLPGADRAMSIVSTAMLFFLFHFHFHQEVALESQMHGFFSWMAVMLLLAHVAEMLGRHLVWMALLRPYALYLIGQWFCQISYVLYMPLEWPRTWDDSSLASIMTVNFLLMCHMLVSFLVFVLLAILIRHIERRRFQMSFLTTNNLMERKQLLDNVI